jgi:hypothetical protein
MDFSFLGGYNQSGQYNINPQFLQMLAQAGSSLGKGNSVGTALGDAASQAARMQTLMGKNPQLTPTPTPVGQPGPDSVTTKQTADGTTTTIQTPPQRNLQTYGTSVPPEAQTSQMGGVSDQSPFFRNLLGLIS